MPGFDNKQLAYNVLSGNSVVVVLGSIVVAFAQTSTQTVDFGTESLYGIGTAKPQEIQQLKFAPSITLDSFVLTNAGLKALSYPSTLLQVLANNSFDIHLIDNNGVPLLSYISCVAVNYSQNVPVNAIITQALSFQALDVLDQAGMSILNGPFALNIAGQAALTAAGTSIVGA